LAPFACARIRAAANGEEVRELRELRRQSADSALVFVTERVGPFTPDAVNRPVKRIGARAGFAFPGACSHAAARLRRLREKR
jgi:hypothetical protein